MSTFILSISLKELDMRDQIFFIGILLLIITYGYGGIYFLIKINWFSYGMAKKR